MSRDDVTCCLLGFKAGITRGLIFFFRYWNRKHIGVKPQTQLPLTLTALGLEG